MAGWWVPLSRLRPRSPRDREVAGIGAGLAAEAHQGADLPAARRVLAVKLELAAATGEVSSCASCARGKPDPRGRYAGGDCCSGETSLVFSPDEIAALAQTGTSAADLAVPSAPAAGCAFRGPTGCTLAVAHRPAICVRYACATLQRELHERGRLDAVEPLAIELGAALQAFADARADRHAQELAEALVASLRAPR